MFLRTRPRANMYDPLFMRTVKKTLDRYRNAVGDEQAPIANEAFLDIDEHGPAWHLGHMRSASRTINEKMKDFDFIVDIRDARLPFTTCNQDLMQVTREKKRIVIFNKAELSNEEANISLQKYFEDQGMYAIFTSVHYSWKDTVDTIRKFVKYVLPETQFKLTAHVGCVVGMPNVGKSTLINALRMAHEYQFHREDQRRSRVGEVVSVTPGTTRQVRSVAISKEPNIVLYDTPGITMPGCVSNEAGLKLAACGVLPTNSVTLPNSRVARYIYDVLHASNATEHVAECLHLPRAPVSFDDLTMLVAARSASSAITPMGNLLTDHAHSMIVNDFKTGRLGRITLDRVPARVVKHNADAAPRLGSGRGTPDPDPDISEFSFTHHVKSREVERSFPADVASVLSAIHESPATDECTISRVRGPIVTESATAPAKFHRQTAKYSVIPVSTGARKRRIASGR